MTGEGAKTRRVECVQLIKLVDNEPQPGQMATNRYEINASFKELRDDL